MNDSSGLESHCSSASRADSMKPIDSSSGVVCALPTTKLPAPSTMNVSVIVPPASIASTRGSRSAIPHLGLEPIPFALAPLARHRRFSAAGSSAAPVEHVRHERLDEIQVGALGGRREGL